MANGNVRCSTALVRMSENKCFVSVAHFSSETVVIPRCSLITQAMTVEVTEIENLQVSFCRCESELETNLSKVTVGENVFGPQKDQLLTLLHKYPQCFPNAERPLEKFTGAEDGINTRDAVPVSQHQY